MGFKEQFTKEKNELQRVKRPYETASFLIFAVMLFQQLFYWVLRLIQHFKNIKAAAGAWNPNFGTNLPTTPAFVIRLIQIDSTKWLWIFVGFLGLVLWYFLIYLFVWNYCRKHGYAKWTWTALIAFLPVNLFFVPAYIWYALYVFRPHMMRFIKRAVEEYKAFDPEQPFPEDLEDPVEDVVEEVKEDVVEEKKEQKNEE